MRARQYPAASGLSFADWAVTAEGRAFADMQEAIIENDIDRGNQVDEPPGPSAESLENQAQFSEVTGLFRKILIKLFYLNWNVRFDFNK